MRNLILTVFTLVLSLSVIQAQDKKEEIQVRIKEGAKPDVYVDGKKFDFPLELIDKGKIESFNVISRDQTKNGIILITTKKRGVEIKDTEIKVTGYANEKGGAPIVVIDGKIADKLALKRLSPDDIDKIKVVKEGAIANKYKAKNGVVIVTTKK